MHTRHDKQLLCLISLIYPAAAGFLSPQSRLVAFCLVLAPVESAVLILVMLAAQMPTEPVMCAARCHEPRLVFRLDIHSLLQLLLKSPFNWISEKVRLVVHD